MFQNEFKSSKRLFNDFIIFINLGSMTKIISHILQYLQYYTSKYKAILNYW